MVAVEENIRTNLSARTSVLLQRVFALQDKRYNSFYPTENYTKNSRHIKHPLNVCFSKII
jgi:hypothetical protein